MSYQKIILFFSLYLTSYVCYSQQNSVYNSYILQYKDVAIEQMNKHKIPASITLAQGLLESAAGQSKLARKANNHFGIKCGSTWKGKYVRHDDDKRGEKFRAYDSPIESYEDHSVFLTTRAHYAPLFSLELTDYKGWAHGLKKAGYATNPRYAHQLIKIIEDYNLYKYDQVKSSQTISVVPTTKSVSKNTSSKTSNNVNIILENELIVRIRNKNYYIIAKHGDTFKSISEQTGISQRKLRNYNEVDKTYELSEGDIVYLQKKRSKAERKWKGKYHIVMHGQSIYTIAQIYGVKIKTLYKLNDLPYDYRAEFGDKLRIR